MKKKLLIPNNLVTASGLKPAPALKKIFLSLCLVLTVSLVEASSPNDHRHLMNRVHLAIRKDTVPLVNRGHVTSTILVTIDGKQYKLLALNNSVTALYINDERVPDEKINDYKTITDKIIEDFNGHGVKPVKPVAAAKKQTTQPVTHISESVRPVAKPVVPIEIQGQKEKQAADQQRISSLKYAKQLSSQTERLQHEIIADLISANAIKDEIGLSFKLTDVELIINGIKQSEPLHKKLKLKYIKGPGWEFNYQSLQAN